MGLPRSGDVASRFSAFIDGLMSVIGHAARAKPLRDYCTGLMMPCDRKSVEPMAAITATEPGLVLPGDRLDPAVRMPPRCACGCAG